MKILVDHDGEGYVMQLLWTGKDEVGSVIFLLIANC